MGGVFCFLGSFVFGASYLDSASSLFSPFRFPGFPNSPDFWNAHTSFSNAATFP